jgi:hypothetical protein
MTESFYSFLDELISDYIQEARKSFQKRIDAWKIDIFEKETNEVVGGLLARQLSLATNIAISPQIWNAHVLPIVLRCMADVYITFCWISVDLKTRSRQFIEYGLGQEKLAIEKYREALSEEDEPDPDANEFLEAREKLLNSECASFLIPINLGSWSEKSTRDMAMEVGEKRFYDLVFTQFSSAVHSTWQHIWRINLYPCTNPLHMGHRIPNDPELPLDPQTFTNSAKYLCKTFARFDKTILGLSDENNAYECYDLLYSRFANYYNNEKPEETANAKKKPSTKVSKKRQTVKESKIGSKKRNEPKNKSSTPKKQDAIRSERGK